MNYTLEQLYEEIRKSGKVLGRFMVSNEREYGSGSIYFTSSTGKYRHVYASPHWDVEDFDTVIDKATVSTIALQVEEFDPATGEHLSSDPIAEGLPYTMLGDLDKDVEHYFEVIGAYLSTLN